MTPLASLTRDSLRGRSPLIVERLLRSDATLEATELLGSSLGTQTWVAFKAVCGALAGANLDSEVLVPGRSDGEFVRMKRTQAGVIVCEGQSAGDIVWELGLLDPLASVRAMSFETFAVNALPVMPDEQQWRVLVNTRPLTPTELGKFVAGVLDTAGSKLSDLAEAFAKTDKVTVEHLVPSGKAFYESLVGAIPEAGVGAQGYLSQTLYPHLRAVFKKDAQWGWLCAQAAYVGPSVDLAEALKTEADDTLLAAADHFEPLTPLGYVAKISAALPRAQGNAAILAMAQRAVEAVVQDALKEPQDRGSELLFPALFRLTLCCINADEQMWQAPPYWRRLAAFTHAQMLLQFNDFVGVVPADFEKWSKAVGSRVGNIATFVDTWTEPAWLPDADFLFAPWLTSTGYAIRLCGDCSIGEALFGQEQRTQLDFPEGKAGVAQMFGLIPDLLCGAVRAEQREDTVMDDELAALLGTEPTGATRSASWTTLLLNARLKTFPEQLRSAVLTWIENLAETGVLEPNVALEHLCVAGRVAAVQPDERMADVVAQVAMSWSSRCTSAELSCLLWLCLVLCAGARAEPKERDDWMDQRLLELAFRLPKGAASIDLAARIGAMQQLQPLAKRRFGRARYAAMSAFS